MFHSYWLCFLTLLIYVFAHFWQQAIQRRGRSVHGTSCLGLHAIGPQWVWNFVDGVSVGYFWPAEQQPMPLQFLIDRMRV